MKTVLVILFAATLFSGCKKDKGEDQLPPATQIGANTFGCKINGKVFVPKGFDGTGMPNPHTQYDYLLNGQPYLSIEANRYLEDSNGGGGISITFWDIIQPGYYDVSSKFRFSFGWPIVTGNCGMSIIDSNLQVFGGGVITKLDIPNHIVSGTFDFKAIKPNCDTVFVTDGRFDIRF